MWGLKSAQCPSDHSWCNPNHGIRVAADRLDPSGAASAKVPAKATTTEGPPPAKDGPLPAKAHGHPPAESHAHPPAKDHRYLPAKEHSHQPASPNDGHPPATDHGHAASVAGHAVAKHANQLAKERHSSAKASPEPAPRKAASKQNSHLVLEEPVKPMNAAAARNSSPTMRLANAGGDMHSLYNMSMRDSLRCGGGGGVCAEMEQETAILDKEYQKLMADFEKRDEELQKLRLQRAKATEEAAAELPKVDPGTGPQVSELKKQVADQKQNEAKLKELLKIVASKYQELQKQKKELEHQRKHAKSQVASSPEAQKLLNQIEAATIQKEALSLQAAELELEIEEKRDAHEAQTSEAANWTNEDPTKLIEEEKVEVHREALRKLYEEHQDEMRSLRKRVNDLEKALERLGMMGGASPEEVEGMRNAIAQLTHETENLEGSSNNIRQAAEERRRLKQDSDQLTKENQALEKTLREELDYQLKRACQLETLAAQLGDGRPELKARQQEQRAVVGRLEVRLQRLQNQIELRPAHEQQPEAIDLETCDIDIALVAASARADGAKADAWAACLPDILRKEAELGDSFNALCALHRCFHKAQILSSCIHEYFIDNSAFAVQSHSAARMQWLCRTCLASAQVAYVAAGILGRMHAYDVRRYVEVVRLPAIRASVNAEGALDAALGVLGSNGQAFGVGPPEIITALGAFNAQLLSCQRSAFKDEPFASWQSAGCAVEAMRAVCTMALYASVDAGGSKRNRWQKLYETSDKLTRRLAQRARKGTTRSMELLAVQGAIPGSQQETSADPGLARSPAHEEGAVASEEGLPQQESSAGETEEGTKKTVSTKHIAKVSCVLNQVLLDGVLAQVAALEVNAMREPNSEEPGGDGISDVLHRALSNASASLATIEKANSWKVDENPASIGLTPRPWERAWEAMQRQIEEVERGAHAEKNSVENELKKTNKALLDLDGSLEKVKEDVVEAEQSYSAARIDTERSDLIANTVTRMRSQAEFGATNIARLRVELQREDDQKKKVTKETSINQKHCQDLQHQLNEYERRLQKQFSHNVSPEDVIALRQTCARQRRDIASQQKSKAACPLSLLQSGQASDKPIKDVSALWKDLQDVQTDLLNEYATTSILDIINPEAKKEMQHQQVRLSSLVQKTHDLRSSITRMLDELARADEKNCNIGAHFTSLALSRHLKATSESINWGPMAKLTLPAPTSLNLPMVAEFSHLQSLHAALI